MHLGTYGQAYFAAETTEVVSGKSWPGGGKRGGLGQGRMGAGGHVGAALSGAKGG